jgi:hypothetical protein
MATISSSGSSSIPRPPTPSAASVEIAHILDDLGYDLIGIQAWIL